MSAGFTSSCCNTSTSSSCRGTGGNSTCYCDEFCYINNNCCPDINQTSCVQSNLTETGEYSILYQIPKCIPMTIQTTDLYKHGFNHLAAVACSALL